MPCWPSAGDRSQKSQLDMRMQLPTSLSRCAIRLHFLIEHINKQQPLSHHPIADRQGAWLQDCRATFAPRDASRGGCAETVGDSKRTQKLGDQLLLAFVDVYSSPDTFSSRPIRATSHGADLGRGQEVSLTSQQVPERSRLLGGQVSH